MRMQRRSDRGKGRSAPDGAQPPPGPQARLCPPLVVPFKWDLLFILAAYSWLALSGRTSSKKLLNFHIDAYGDVYLYFIYMWVLSSGKRDIWKTSWKLKSPPTIERSLRMADDNGTYGIWMVVGFQPRWNIQWFCFERDSVGVCGWILSELCLSLEMSIQKIFFIWSVHWMRFFSKNLNWKQSLWIIKKWYFLNIKF